MYIIGHSYDKLALFFVCKKLHTTWNFKVTPCTQNVIIFKGSQMEASNVLEIDLLYFYVTVETISEIILVRPTPSTH